MTIDLTWAAVLVYSVGFRGEVHNLLSWSRLSGTPTSTIRHRLEQGWLPEQAIFSSPGVQGVGRKRRVLLVVEGEEKSIEEWSSLFGVGRTTIEARLKRGWGPDQAVTTPVDRKKSLAAKSRRRGSSL
jgi:hypothetical protein